MRKVALLVAGMFVLSMMVAAAEIPAGKEVIKFDVKMPGPVTFDHKAHVDRGAKCEDCHHAVKGKEGAAPQSCAACHDAKEAKGAAPKLKDAVHKTCQGCHEKAVAAGKKAPGKACNACHVKSA